MQQATTPSKIANLIDGCHFISTEFMYQPRPSSMRERIIFDYALRTRLNELRKGNAVVFICRDQETIESLRPFATEFHDVLMASIIVNPQPYIGKTHHTPEQLNWETPKQWRRMQTTDRWARIDTALHIASLIQTPAYLLMPAHDAIWGNNLLKRLENFSHHYSKNGQPAAVSPYTYYQHSQVPNAHIPPDIIHILNTAFSRDSLFALKIRRDKVQAFWGKMSMTPTGICGAIRESSDRTLWEDDLDIDRIIREKGYGVRCLWINNQQLYRQALPVFDIKGIERVIERNLHYSLHVPGEPVGGSNLNKPLDWIGRIRQMISPRFRYYNMQAEHIIARCIQPIVHRLGRYDASWVDWGGYRHVVRIRDPVVEVWEKYT